MTGALDRLAFRALGTTCVLATSATPLVLALSRRALLAGRAEVETCERVLSRFDPDSDLSRANRAAGRFVRVDTRLVEALERAVELRAETGGRCDPTVLPALVSAGYDRSYELLTHEAPATPAPAGALVEIDRRGSRVRVEAGAAVDLGGSAKGYIAARALAAMRRAWPELPGAIADLGGDVAVVGRPPEPGAWRVTVADPRPRPGPLGTIRLSAGAAATSGPSVRRFGPGRSLHHLIAPGTGLPAVGGPEAATVVAGDPAAADAHATALAVTPLGEAASYLGAHPELGAVLVPEDGPPLVLGSLDFTPAALEVVA